MKLILAALLVAVANSYPNFQQKIPNGAIIPNPCPEVLGTIWNGVGHREHEGGGTRNPFGRDFEMNNYEWDECLCRQDSDGDGKTNGEEMGDPDCVWTEGAEPSISDMSMLSHPGICDPVNSPECADANFWLDCSSMLPFKCDAFDAPDTLSIDMTIERTPVLPKETIYLCTAMEFPQEIQDGDFHMIGAEAIIDNTDVMHHMVVYACPDNEDVKTALMNQYRTSVECGNMVTEFCYSAVYIWAIGADGYCFDPQFGVRLGRNGFTMFVVEFHMNNVGGRAGQTDASGFRVYYTPELREFDALTIFFGKNYLDIPPGRKRVVEEGVCSSVCTTRMMQESIFIPQIIPHTHMLGVEFIVDQYRNGTHLRRLFREDSFDYNSPRTFKFNPHIEVLPGDEISVSCIYDSTDRDDFTVWGGGALDEMCVAITMFYPFQASMGNCWGGEETTAVCSGEFVWDEDALAPCTATTEAEVFLEAFYLPYLDYYENLTASCDMTGLSCLPGCEEVIESVKEHPCFNDKAVYFTKAYYLPDVVASMPDLPISPPDSVTFFRGMVSCDPPEERHDVQDDLPEGSCPFASPTPADADM